MSKNYIVDAGNLAITETTVVSGEQRSEEELLASATRAAKLLFAELLQLPRRAVKGKNDAHFFLSELPVPLMRRPREKAPPKEKPLTAWQKFALKKGIDLHKKKNNKKWDEARQEWKDRWGKRARESERQSDWIREVPKNYIPGQPGSDPFLDEKQEKKASLDKAKKNQERNQRRAVAVAKAQFDAAKIDRTMSKLATASMGKFDKVKRPASKKKS